MKIRAIELIRGGWGAVLLAAPAEVRKHIHGVEVDRKALVVTRILGARHLVQAALSGSALGDHPDVWDVAGRAGLASPAQGPSQNRRRPRARPVGPHRGRGVALRRPPDGPGRAGSMNPQTAKVRPQNEESKVRSRVFGGNTRLMIW